MLRKPLKIKVCFFALCNGNIAQEFFRRKAFASIVFHGFSVYEAKIFADSEAFMVYE